MRRKEIKDKLKRIDNQGYTIIEVMIALAVFAIGILAVFSMQISAINGNGNACRLTESSTWAVDRVEQLMSLPYDDALLLAGEHSVGAGSFTQENDLIDNDADGEIDEAGESGHVRIHWTVWDNVPRTDTKTVRVTVTESNPLRRDRVVNLDFIKANMPGL